MKTTTDQKTSVFHIDQNTKKGGITMKKKNLFTRMKEFIVESFHEYNEAVIYCIQHNLLKVFPDRYSYQIAF